MNKLILAGAAALALAVPAAAQDMAVTADGDVYVLTSPQQTMYDAWPVERQTVYTAWPNDYKVYYWTLAPRQAEGWWVLTDDQRTRVYGMTPEQRVAAWTAIEAQMGGNTTAMAATTAAASASTMGPRFVSNQMVETTPASATATANLTNAADLPVCTKNQQDGCINSWEKNKTGTRPLGYWPGKPASEMPGNKPAM